MSTQRLLSETAPLLPETTPLPDDSTTHDDDAPEEPTRSPREQRHSLYRWLTFWSLFAVGLFFLVRAALVEGGGKFSWGDSLRKALGGGVAGGLAMILQVLTLMPLRTTMNFQYRRGGSTLAAYTFLKNDGGFTRFYKGLGPALIQGPLGQLIFEDRLSNCDELTTLLRCSSFRRHSRQCRHPRPPSIESSVEESPRLAQDGSRFIAVGRLPNDSISPRRAEDDDAD